MRKQRKRKKGSIIKVTCFQIQFHRFVWVYVCVYDVRHIKKVPWFLL